MAIPATHRARIFSGGSFVLGATVSALLVGGVGYYFVKQSNTIMVIQQQEIADLSQFGATGATLDKAVGHFANALAKGAGVEAAREELNAAIVNHSSFVFNNMRGAIGPADSAAYMAQLNGLRVAVKTTVSLEDGVQVFQKAADLIAFRKRITDRITVSIKAT